MACFADVFSSAGPTSTDGVKPYEMLYSVACFANPINKALGIRQLQLAVVVLTLRLGELRVVITCSHKFVFCFIVLSVRRFHKLWDILQPIAASSCLLCALGSIFVPSPGEVHKF